MLADPRARLVLPLDVPSRAEARALLDELGGEVGIAKVGLELFVAEGPGVVLEVVGRGIPCFLDLKLHDIPATMAGAVRSAVRLGARFLTVHAAAGREGLRAAAEAARGSATTLVAVTVLTSLDQEELASVGLAGGPAGAALRLALLARDAGIGALVCSAAECLELRAALGTATALIVPGIRPAGAGAADQRRVATPREAVRAGADLLVVGRPILGAPDRRAAARAVVAEIAAALP